MAFTASNPAQTNFHAGLLLQLVEGLQAPFTYEPSIRLCRRAILANRFLITIAKPEVTPDELFRICRRLAMPEALIETARRDLEAARFLHFGFEENEKSCLFKLYLEFGFDKENLGATVLQHRAFKWDVGDPARYVETQYVWHPNLSAPRMVQRLADIYRGEAGAASFGIVEDLLELAMKKPGHEPNYLEVTEDANGRRSFDLNLYDAKLQVRDLQPLLARMAKHFEVPAERFAEQFDGIQELRFGHLAGGVHRGGEDFFNLYYGAAKRERVRPVRTGWAMGNLKRLVQTTEQDQYYNYCWWPYLPVAPTENKYRAATLLHHSFEVAGLDDRAEKLVEMIQVDIGLFRTVWGTKWLPEKTTPLLEDLGAAVNAWSQAEQPVGRLGWEYYFYDYQRRQRQVSISRLLETIRPLMPCDVPIHEGYPYFMFSLDVNGELLSGKRKLDVVHMYIGNPGSKVSSGVAYALTEGSTVLENFYFFFDAQRDLRAAAEKIYCSAHVDSDLIEIDRLLIPELRNCHTICVANKQKNDTVYFSGVNVDQLLFFLKMLHYPPALISFVEENRGKLDHLLYDVGFDYVAKGRELEVVKSGYYGVF